MERNIHKAFDTRLTELLGFYVYGLFDPETGQPFYIGKGGGKEAKGNRRVLAHFEEARLSYRKGIVISGKVACIHSIWDRGQDVVWKVLRRQLASEAEAHIVEGAIMDALIASGIELMNEQGGHHGRSEGLLDMEGVYALGALDLDPAAFPDSLIETPIFVFNIASGYRERGDYRLATVGHWDVRGKFVGVTGAVAVGVIDGISRAVVGIERWVTSPEVEGRSVIAERPLREEETEALRLRNIKPAILDPCSGFWQRGGFLVFRVTQERQIRIMRGLGSSGTGEAA